MGWTGGWSIWVDKWTFADRVEEEDDTLLNRLQLSDDVTVPALRPLEQALLLLHANVLRASRQALPCRASTCLFQSNNWAPAC